MIRALIVALLFVYPVTAAQAQRLAPIAISASHSVADSHPVTAPSPSRGSNAGRGALIGAAALGITLAVAASRDHTGEGLVAPVMFAAGALLGALIGALVGLVWPN